MLERWPRLAVCILQEIYLLKGAFDVRKPSVAWVGRYVTVNAFVKQYKQVACEVHQGQQILAAKENWKMF